MGRFARQLVLTLAILGPGRAAMAQAAPAPDRVEEDWRLVVATPDVTGIGPQITTSMCPAADATQWPFVALDMNYCEYPSFAAGGMQAQVWSAGNLVVYDSSSATAQLATAGETIAWTQRMSLSDGRITYKVRAGSSTTWGAFGDDFGVSFDTSLTSLSGYSPATTVANSGVSWQVNNVRKMTLLAVRYYANGVLISTDSTERPIVTDGAPAAQGPSCTLRPRALAPRSGRAILASASRPPGPPARTPTEPRSAYPGGPKRAAATPTDCRRPEDGAPTFAFSPGTPAIRPKIGM